MSLLLLLGLLTRVSMSLVSGFLICLRVEVRRREWPGISSLTYSGLHFFSSFFFPNLLSGETASPRPNTQPLTAFICLHKSGATQPKWHLLPARILLETFYPWPSLFLPVTRNSLLSLSCGPASWRPSPNSILSRRPCCPQLLCNACCAVVNLLLDHGA